jgi:hypothetical protein
MNDRPRIVGGLVVALAALAFPFWYALAAGRAAPPKVDLPAGQAQCVEDAQYMKANHMDLLNRWRDAVVRNGKKMYVSKAFGKSYEMSFTKTCMGCHTNRKTFCDRCHTYANVQPTCWDCHVEPKKK